MEQQINISQNNNQEILINSNEPQLISLTNNEVQDILINQNENQNLNVTQPDNQLILIDGGGNIIGITDVLVNGVTVVSGNIAYITVPTKTSELINNSGFITSETDPTVPSYIKQISLSDINSWNNKQDQLVSGSTIKTINNESLLGSGNINITGTEYNAGDGISIENNIINNTITSYNDLSDLPTLPTKTSDLINDSEFVSEDDLSEVAFTGSYNSLSDTPIIPDSTSDLTNDGADGTHPYIPALDSGLKGLGVLSGRLFWEYGSNLTDTPLANYSDIPTKTSDLTNDGSDGAHPFVPNNDNLGVYGLKALTSDGLNLQYIIGPGNTTITLQDKLVSGTNIKTINNESLLGSGNIDIPIKSFIEAGISAEVTIPSGSYIEITNFTSQISRGNLSIDNGKIKIGSGISYVKVTVTLSLSSNSDTLYSFITKNGNNDGTWIINKIDGFSATTRSDIIQVTENDTISVNVYLNNGGSLPKGRTSIIVESI